MAEEAQADLALDDDRPSPGRIALRSGQGAGNFIIRICRPGDSEEQSECKTFQTNSRPWFLSGTERRRLPVAR